MVVSPDGSWISECPDFPQVSFCFFDLEITSHSPYSPLPSGVDPNIIIFCHLATQHKCTWINFLRIESFCLKHPYILDEIMQWYIWIVFVNHKVKNSHYLVFKTVTSYVNKDPSTSLSLSIIYISSTKIPLFHFYNKNVSISWKCVNIFMHYVK